MENKYHIAENKVKGRKIDSLQALRAFAAISVMFFHGTEVLYDKLGYVFLNNFFLPGFSGVQIFFVLSGFIILYTSFSKNLSSKDFLIKRIIRIYPVHTLVILFLVAVYFLSPSQDQAYRGVPGNIISSLTLIPFAEMVLGPSWTLSFEMMFYLIFAFTFLKSARKFVITVVVWALIIVLGLLFHFKTSIGVINNFIDPINFNFIFGCLIAFLFIHKPIIKGFHWLIVPASVIFFICWRLEVKAMIPNDSLGRLIFFGIPSAFLVLGVLYSKVKFSGFFIFLGDASYSLYLLHFPLIRILVKFFLKIKIINHNYLALSLLVFLFTLIISCVFYIVIEKRLTTFLKKQFLVKK